MSPQRRALGALAAGHACADLCQGTVPALVPFLVHERGLTYGQTGLLVLVMSVTSSVLQPLLGLWADRREAPWAVPAGVAVGGVGVAGIGLASSFATMAAATAVAGLGIALFHPEGARRATRAAGARAAGGLSVFAVGGSAGFALAPVILTPAVLVAGLPGTVVVLVPTLAVALLLARTPPEAGVAPAPVGVVAAAPAADRPGPFALLAVVSSLRAGAYFGLQAFLAAALVARLGATPAEGNAALTVLLVAGAGATLVGGRLADSIGRRPVIVASLALTVPTLALAQIAPTPALAVAAAALVGAAVVSSYSATIVLGQELLPSRPSLAAGTTLGLAMGAGGLVVAALGPLADAAGPVTALWVVLTLPAAGALLARWLPKPTASPAADRRPPAPARRRPASDPSPPAAA